MRKTLHISSYYLSHIGRIEQLPSDIIESLSDSTLCFNDKREPLIEEMENVKIASPIKKPAITFAIEGSGVNFVSLNRDLNYSDRNAKMYGETTSNLQILEIEHLILLHLIKLKVGLYDKL